MYVFLCNKYFFRNFLTKSWFILFFLSKFVILCLERLTMKFVILYLERLTINVFWGPDHLTFRGIYYPNEQELSFSHNQYASYFFLFFGHGKSVINHSYFTKMYSWKLQDHVNLFLFQINFFIIFILTFLWEKKIHPPKNKWSPPLLILIRDMFSNKPKNVSWMCVIVEHT